MIDRRTFLTGTGAVLLAAPLAVEAQPEGKRPRIALLFNNTPLAEVTGPQPTSREARAFLDGMRDLGWLDGTNITIERRSAEGQPDRYTGLIQELVDLRVDLVVVSSGQPAQMIKKVSDTLPVVMAGAVSTNSSGTDSLPVSLDRLGP